ncbi:M1 family metallopeptidase [Ekhidna sp. To15]|uniref:M1 family metallopeptidase n=1 Tax=Ekhidna sp. To15 TaxID=3395267 RepID=UPI003F5245E0
MRQLLLLITMTLCVSLVAQEKRFFMPKEMKQAYDKGTRSYDGKPGASYWHNTVDYDIKVAIDPETRGISGTSEITYTNNSPDDLSTIVVRLYNDVYRKGNPRASRVDERDIDDGVTLNMVQVRGDSVDMESRSFTRNGTNIFIRLSESLKSGEKIDLAINWEQFVPYTNRRTGVADSTSFFVAYWYPQVAVYDDVFGWDTQNYSFRTEFYNNLANFNVEFTVPKSFTVWATGVLQNPDEVFNANILERYNKALTATEPMDIINGDDLKDGFEHKSGTWKFKADEVPDFAFAMSDHYDWNAASQKVAGNDVLISSVYPTGNPQGFAAMTPNQQKTMKHFSEDIPGVPYPYPRFTTFIGLGGGGMEFPMMAYNGGPGLGVTVHEMYHMYFPMYVRVNERRFAWMDEGWADYITSLVTSRFFRNDSSDLFTNYKGSVGGMQGQYEDVPLFTSSQFMDGTNYGYSAYPLPAFIYSMLHFHLGDEMFLKAYQEYINRWAKKSPIPFDFFYTFEDVSGQDLSWLWKPWFFEYGYPNVKIDGIKKDKLTVSNMGNRPVPVQVEVKYNDGTDYETSMSAKSMAGKDKFEVIIPNYKKVESISVNASLPDLDDTDNFYPPLKDRMAGVEVPEFIYGTYNIANFNIQATMKMEDGLVKAQVPAAGMNVVVMPKDGKWISLDGQVVVEFDNSGEKTAMSMELKQFGVTVEGTKE